MNVSLLSLGNKEFLVELTNSTTRKCIGPFKRDDGRLALADDEKACLMN